jgi:sugar phosphate isomerase/epimerase
VHAADTAKIGELKQVLLGTGLVNFKEIFKRLKSFGFNDWISMEEASFQGEDGIKKALDFVKKTWEIV